MIWRLAHLARGTGRVELRSVAPRLIAAIVLAAFTLVLLYVVPTVIGLVATSISQPKLRAVLSHILVPTLPAAGIIASVLVFTVITLRKTRFEGPMLLLLGTSLIAYLFLLFHGGSLIIDVPNFSSQQFLSGGIPVDVELSMMVNLMTLMLASMITPILILIKGLLLTARRFRGG